jgi:hypothetical protein
VEDGGDQPQHVHGREHDRGGADDRPAPALLEDAREDQELTGEARRERDRERDDPGRHQHRRERRSPARHPPEQHELAGRSAALDHPREQEERGRDEAVVHHLQHGAVEAEVVRGEEAVADQAQLRERRVRDDAADVRRPKREQRAVHQAGGRKHEYHRPEVISRLRELADRDAQESVRRDLRDHAREQRRHLGRRLTVGIGQPAVKRPQRRLDREREREAEEEPVVRARPHPREVERALLQPVDDHRRQHQERAGDGVDDEGDRRAHPAGAAPDADQHVERDQHRLEEGVEDEQVLRGKDADGGAGEEEEQAEVGTRPLAADPPRVHAGGCAADDRQPDEPKREAELAHVPGDAEVAEPFVPLLELETAPAEAEALDCGDPDADLDEGHERRERPDPLPRERREPEHERARGRQRDQDRRQPAHRAVRKTTASTATPLASARAYERTRPFWARLTSPAPKRKLRVTSASDPATTGCSKNRRSAQATSAAGR